MRALARIAGTATVGLLLVIGVDGASPQGVGDDLPGPATLESCSECHRDLVVGFELTPHATLDSRGLAERAGFDSSCDACHGEKRPPEGGVASKCLRRDQSLTFRPDELPLEKSSRCLHCHAGKRSRFYAAPHGMVGMDCSSCHDIHGSDYGRWPLQRAVTDFSSSLTTESEAAVCWECHEDILAQFEGLETHRLREGILECTSCHDPHQPQTRPLLGGFKQEQCLGCHADKAGPFVFEHAASRVEGCTACHSAHGSPNRHMLAHQSTAELCFSCHAAVPGFHARFTLDTVCTNCHSAIHGSNFSAFFVR